MITAVFLGPSKVEAAASLLSGWRNLCFDTEPETEAQTFLAWFPGLLPLPTLHTKFCTLQNITSTILALAFNQQPKTAAKPDLVVVQLRDSC